MSEHISLQSTIGPPRKTELEVTTALPFQGGIRDKTHFETELIVGNRSRVLKWVRRQRYGENDARDYFQVWNRLRELGFPVVNTVRQDNKYAYIPDLTSDGSRVYGRGLQEYLDMDQSQSDPYYVDLFYSTSSLDQVFLQLIANSLPEVQAKVGYWRDFATQNGVGLPEDAFVIYVRPNGKWQLLMLDVEKATFDTISDKNKAMILERNTLVSEKFMHTIQELARLLNRKLTP